MVGHSPSVGGQRTPPSTQATKGVRLDTATAVALNNKVQTEMMIIDGKSERGYTGASSARGATGSSSRLDSKQLTYRNLLTGTNSMAPGALIKSNAQYPRQDRWTPRSKLKTAGDDARVQTARSTFPSYEGEDMIEEQVDPKVLEVQDKVQEQLKRRRNFRVQSAGEGIDSTLNEETFRQTLTIYGLDLTEDEQQTLFEHYKRDGTGGLDYEELMQGIRGSEFVQTAKSYGFETPDPGEVQLGPNGKPFSHHVPVTEDLKPQTAQSARAWQQQRASDACPFGMDRKIFGGKWMYRTSSLIKAEPVVTSRYGKTAFPARKHLSDIVHVIAEKMQERSKASLSLTRMFNSFDTDKNGYVDKAEFCKLLEVYNIQLNDSELQEVYDHFGAVGEQGEPGGIRYLPFVQTVENHFRAHPLGGVAGAGLPGAGMNA